MLETKLDGGSKDILNENIETLKELFPEIVSEDKIDFDKFKTIFGGEIDDSSERYSFTWPGKTQAIKESQKQSTGTLRPCKEESKNWDTTKNLYIEGDNLEVLKLHQKGYYNKIKAIYIDPPYNTGKDFIYPDNYQDNLENYLKISGQVLESKEYGERERESIGVKLTSNPETAGRYHSNWLNMMYPRLKLARNLLSDDGVIFISIDDNEIENLKKICDEIFGEENFVSQSIRRTINSGKHDSTAISVFHEYLLIYSKFINNLNLNKKPKSDEEKDKLYNQQDKFVEERGRYYLTQLNKNSIRYSDSLNFPIKGPDGIDIWPGNGFEDKEWCWRWSKDKVKWGIENKYIQFKKSGEKYKVYTKSYEKRDNEGKVIDRNNPYNSLEFISKEYANFNATPELSKLFDGKKLFNFPKSQVYLKEILKLSNTKNSLVLDFFSGSSTMAHAMLSLNSEDNGNRNFIMVQIPEETDDNSEAYKAGYKNICEIGKERIRRAGDKIVKESGNKDLDIGFKVFKLDSSNLEKWDPDYDDLEQTLLVSQDNIKEGRTQEDLIYEIMLKYGIDLTLPIEKYESENTMYSIGFAALLVCLDNKITKDITDSIIELASEDVSRVVFKDNGFASDADKTNIKETLRTHGIDEFITI